MADFINTIDALGDAVVMDSIINRTITEFKDNSIATIGQCAFHSCSLLSDVSLPLAIETGKQAFRSCKSLKSVSFPAAAEVSYISFESCTALESIDAPVATSVQNYGLQGCTSLTRVDFPCVNAIKSGGFNNCKALDTLILRYDGVCTLADSAALGNTPIANGTGYVYVPSAHVASYQSASNWSAVSAQIRAIEDYPEITGG